MNDDDFSICIDCFSNDLIKKIITDSKDKIVSCDFCKNQHISGLNQDTIHKIKTFIQCYLIYNYDEDDYNRRYGSRSIYETFEEENEIFVWESIKDKDKEAILLDTVFDVIDFDIVSVDEYPVTKAIKNNEKSSELIEIANIESFKIKFERINDFIEDIEKLSIPDDSKKSYYRARKGYDGYRKNGYEIKPHKGTKIGAPPNNIATSGRANREFMSFLYLSEDEETAINEVRPFPGDKVSVGKFKPTKKLNLFYLYNHDILGNSDSYESIMQLEKIAALNNYFSRPTGSDGKSIYVVTQMFVEALALKGYDGIAFESSFTKKINYTIFNPSDFEYIDNSSKVYDINNIHLNISDSNKSRW